MLPTRGSSDSVLQHIAEPVDGYRRHFYIRELVEEGRLTVPFVCSADNLADFFTKPLAPAPFTTLRNRVMGYAH